MPTIGPATRFDNGFSYTHHRRRMSVRGLVIIALCIIGLLAICCRGCLKQSESDVMQNANSRQVQSEQRFECIDGRFCEVSK